MKKHKAKNIAFIVVALSLSFAPGTYAGGFGVGHKDHHSEQALENYLYYTYYNQANSNTSTNNGVGVTIRDTGGAGGGPPP